MVRIKSLRFKRLAARPILAVILITLAIIFGTLAIISIELAVISVTLAVLFVHETVFVGP